MSLRLLKQCIFLEQTSQIQSKNYLAYNEISRLSYLGMNSAVVYLSVAASVWWLLPSLDQAWLLLECISYQKIQHLFLIIYLSNLSLIPAFLLHSTASCKCLSCVFLIAKYIYIFSYFYSTPTVFICLINLPLGDVLTHPQAKRHSQKFVPPKVCVEGCHEQWCCIKFHIPITLFCILFWKRL